jgi:hypothetical protein
MQRAATPTGNHAFERSVDVATFPKCFGAERVNSLRSRGQSNLRKERDIGSNIVGDPQACSFSPLPGPPAARHGTLAFGLLCQLLKPKDLLSALQYRRELVRWHWPRKKKTLRGVAAQLNQGPEILGLFYSLSANGGPDMAREVDDGPAQAKLERTRRASRNEAAVQLEL